MKLLKTSEKKNALKGKPKRGKRKKGMLNTLSETVQAMQQWNDIFKMLKRKNPSLQRKQNLCKFLNNQMFSEVSFPFIVTETNAEKDL